MPAELGIAVGPPPPGTRYTRYSSNNSGGHWWLSDDDWATLARAGWFVEWVTLPEEYGGRRYADPDGRWIGALACAARRYGLDEAAAGDEWARVLGMDPDEQGCPCCGPPHAFYAYEHTDDPWGRML